MEHDLIMKVSTPITLGNTDAEITVRVDGDLLGTLKLSKGTIDWNPRGRHGQKKLSWSQFAELMTAAGTTSPKKAGPARTSAAAQSRAQKTQSAQTKTAPAKTAPARKTAVKKTSTRIAAATRSTRSTTAGRARGKA